MSLGKKLVQAAQKEAALQRPIPYGAEAVEPLPRGGELRATATVNDYDRFTKMASEVKVSVARGHSPPGRGLSVAERAQKFVDKATYLTESLMVVETDPAGASTVRSTPATMAGKGSAYFEAAVKDDEIALRRYKPKPGGREQVPFCVTDDVLGRLVEDAAAALTPRK
jgi:hypothetical protein